MENKRGSLVSNIMLVMVWSLVLIFIVAIVYGIGLIGPIATPIVQEVLTITDDTLQTSGNPALANASDATIKQVGIALNNMEWIAYTLIIFMFLAFIIMCFYARTYPFLLWIWIIMLIVMVFASIYLTVGYQDLRADATLGAYYKEWQNVDFTLRYLPGITAFLGIIGGIIMFMFSRNPRELEAGGGGPL